MGLSCPLGQLIETQDHFILPACEFSHMKRDKRQQQKVFYKHNMLLRIKVAWEPFEEELKKAASQFQVIMSNNNNECHFHENEKIILISLA